MFPYAGHGELTIDYRQPIVFAYPCIIHSLRPLRKYVLLHFFSAWLSSASPRLVGWAVLS
ncbi:hypothetical protein J6590_049047 [Homalodisca vitripennis]|nr:hypothetical protein J6590_049047 [Homalodisca vitripennis]